MPEWPSILWIDLVLTVVCSGREVHMPDEEYFTVKEVAKRLKINPETVRVWIREEKIRATNLGAKRTGYRIPESEVQRILKGGE